MRTQTSQKAELFGRALRMVILGVFAVFVCVSLLTVLKPAATAAATSSTVNFQAKLQTSSGAIVPDGNYNVEFKLYNTSTVTGTPDQGACTYNGGTTDPNCLWVETRTGGNQVRVANGYLTVNLGSVTPFAFTNWNQQLWLTMRIGGTGAPSWDGEMNPRIQLTATPYAFQAGELGNGTNRAVLDGSGSLQLYQQSTINIIQNPSAGAGLQLTVKGGDGNGGTNVGGNLVLQGGAGASTGASGSVLVKSNTNNSTIAFQVQNASGYGLLTADTANSRLGVGINVPLNTFSVAPVDYQTGTVTRTNSSATLVGTGTTWTSAMNGDIIVFADGTTNYVGSFTDATHITMSNTYTGTTDGSPIAYRFYHQGLDVASSGLVGIGITGPDAALSVRTAGQNAVVDIYGASGSPDYGVIQVSSAGSLTNSSNRPLSLQPNNGDVLIATTTDLGAKLSVGGTTLVKTTSTAALQVQNGSAANLFTVDTSNTAIVLGNDATPSALTVRGGAATGTNITGSNITFNASNGTGSGGSGDIIFQAAAAQAPSAVAYDASASNVSSGAVASLSWSHTIGGGSNRLLMVNVMTYTASVSSVTYNGTNLTNLSTLACAAEYDGDTCTDSIWYLKESSMPAAGAHTVQVNLSGSDYVAAGSTSFYNANQTSTFGSTVTATQVADSLTIYVPTTSAKQMVFDAESSQDYGVQQDSNQTLSWNQLGTAGQQGAAGYRQGNGSTLTMTWTETSTSSGSPDNDSPLTETRAVIAVPINPLTVSSSTADTLTDVLHLQSTGNVGINTSNPQATLSVNGNAYVSNGNLDVLGVGAAPASAVVYAGSNQGGSLSGNYATKYYYQISAITSTGETTPSQEISIGGCIYDDSCSNPFTPIAKPASAPTPSVVAGASSFTAGTYKYKVTFKTANGETSASPESSGAVVSGNTQKVNLTIPTGATGTTAREIYRTPAGGTGNEQFLWEVADNTTTVFTDDNTHALGSSLCNCGNSPNTNTNNASLSWAPVTGATSYRIYRGTSSGGENVYFTSATNTYTDTGTAGTSGTVATDTTQRLGIGTASPRTSLDVMGSAIIQTPTNSTTALQVLNNGGSQVLGVDTLNDTLNIAGTNNSATVDYSNEQYGGTFNSGWTSSSSWPTANWTISGTGGDTITHVSGNTTYLTYTGFTFVAGTSYQVTIDEGGTCGTSNDNVFFSIPGINLQSVTTVDGSDCDYSAHTYVGTATSGGNLQIFPSTNWTGSIDYISIIPITVNLQPSIAIQNSSGTSNLTELRARSNDLFFGGAGKFYINGQGVGENTAFGPSSQYSIVDGFSNTSVGAYTLQYNTYGFENTALGDYALNANQGNDNTALGAFAMDSNHTGNDNTAIGVGSLGDSLSGDKNTAIGESALGGSSGASNNVALGYQAGYNVNGSNNTFIGFNAGYQDSGGNFITTTSVQNSTAIGTYAQVQASNSIVLGSVDTATKVGIGTTIPGNTFSISPLEYQTGTATRTNGSATLTGTGTTWLTGGLVTVGDIIVFADGTTNTVSSIASDTSITMGTTYTGTTDASPVHYRFHHVGLQVTSGGYLGINTVSPATPLDVNGNASISGQLNASPITSLPSYVNLVPNWSFEVNNDSVANFPDQWGPSGETTGTVSVLSTSSTNGKNSLELSSGASSSNIAATSSCFPISPSQTYSYATDAYSSAAVNGFVWRVFYFTDSSCTTAASTTFHDVTGTFNNAITASWQTFTGTQTSPSNARFAWIRVYNFQTTNSNLVIDSMVMTPQLKTGLLVTRTDTAALQIQNSSAVNILTVDSSSKKVTIGVGATGESNPTLLVLDNQTGSATDPTEVDGAMYYNVTTNSYRCGANGGWYECSINNIQYNYNFEDDFLGGQASGAAGSLSNVGQLGWAVTQGTSCTVAYNGVGPQGHDHPGVVGLTAGAASGDFCVMAQGGTNAGATTRSEVVAAGDVLRSTVDISSIAQGVFRFGMSNNVTNAVAPTSGAWFEYVRATDATHWRYCYANNAAATCASTTQTISASTWYQLEIRFVASNAITYNLRQLPSGTLETHALSSITYDSGGTNKLSPMYLCDATTTTTFICGVDYFQWQGVITTSGGR